MSKRAAIKPFHVMDILERCKQMEAHGRDVVHMEIGEPDFPSPEPIVRAGISALQKNQTHYTGALGLRELRQRISEFYRRRLRVDVEPEQIVVTPGASGALQLIYAHMLQQKNTIMVSDPGYPCNRNLAAVFGGDVLAVPVNADTQYQLTAESVEKHWRKNIAAVLIASPSNPTGTLCSCNQLLQIADYLAEKNSVLIVDEIYQGLNYAGSSSTVAGLRDNIYVLNSFSKYFGMTGWRVGWLVAPLEQIPRLDAIAQNTYLATSTIAQHAAIAAFSAETHAILEQRRDIFRQRRDLVLAALQNIGVDVPVVPQGAFYIYANVSKFTHDSFEFCRSLLEQTAVAVTPGCDFGEHSAQQHIRFAYTTSEKRLRAGMQRLQEFIATL